MEGLNLATSLLCALGTQVVSGHLSKRRSFLTGPDLGHTPRRFPLPPSARVDHPQNPHNKASLMMLAQSQLAQDSPAAFIQRPLPGELAPLLSLVLPFSIQALS